MIISLLFLLIIILYYKISNNKYKRIDHFNNIYIVNNLPNTYKASKLILSIVKTLDKLINKIIEDHDPINHYDNKYIKYIKYIKYKFPNIRIYENSLDNNNTSYTINKGEKMILCIRDKNTKKLQDFNDILYVAIHEISHVGCPEYGHTKIFNELNFYILKKAVKYKLYNYIDYYKTNKPYCGISLNSTIL